MDKPIRVTVEHGDEKHVYEGHSIIGGIVALPKDAPVQAVIPFNAGEVTPGHWLSMLTFCVTMAGTLCKERGLSPDQFISIMKMAISDGIGKIEL